MVGTARRREHSAVLKPSSAEQRLTNGKNRFRPGTGTRHALRSKEAPQATSRAPIMCECCDMSLTRTIASFVAFVKSFLPLHRKPKPADDFLALSDFLKTPDLYEK
jgi:hypothetical protein